MLSGRPKRVLHVVRAMARGGVETWLMHVLRLLDHRRLQIDFLVHTGRRSEFDAEIEQRGSRLIRCTTSWRSPTYAWSIAELLSGSGPYDAVHSHVHYFSGFLLPLARRAAIPVRIAHSHSDTSRRDAGAGWLRRGYLGFARRSIQSSATHLVAASRVAGRALFGESWELDRRRRLVRCGIDLEPFRTPPPRATVRAEFGIAERDFVIGHTGRFDVPKNHRFLAEIAAEAVRRRGGVRLLLVGDGPLRQQVEARVRELGISSQTIFAGLRQDVPRLLRAMDVFVFPSLWEGLPLTVLEAQAAGLPCVISDVIAEETDVVAGLVRRLPLAAAAADWAAEAIAAAHTRAPAPQESLSRLENSGFNILWSVEDLYALYNA